MIKRYTSHTQINKFVFLTEQEYILYFGQNYEESVTKANENALPLVRARNGNGIISAIPTERANYLIEKYHKLLKRNPSLAEGNSAPSNNTVSTTQ
ncbi:MAG: hypothetical protein ACFB15_18805 [Cyclobacteriaceae bacterium]